MISSKDSPKASRPPATSAERIAGNVMSRNVRARVAPRSIAASSTLPTVLRRRAAALFSTTTTQKVAWPAISVSSVSPPRNVVNTLFRARPVTMPGRAIGSTNSRETVLRPQKSYRETAMAVSVPSTSAMAVAMLATTREVVRASRTPSLRKAACHHSVVYPGGGHWNSLLVLNELTTTMASGT